MIASANLQGSKYHCGDIVLYIIQIIGYVATLVLIAVSATTITQLPNVDNHYEITQVFSPNLISKTRDINLLLLVLCTFTVISSVPLFIVKLSKVRDRCCSPVSFAVGIIFDVIEVVGFFGIGVLAAQTASYWTEAVDTYEIFTILFQSIQPIVNIEMQIAAAAALSFTVCVSTGIVCVLDIALFIFQHKRSHQYDSI